MTRATLAALALWASAFGAANYAGPAAAQSGEGYLAFVEWCRSINGTHVPGPGYGRCDPGSSYSSTADGWGAQLGALTNQWVRRQLSGDAARSARYRRAVALNNQANATDNLDEALRLYRQARDLSSNPVIRLNMMDALIRVAGRDFQARDPNDAAALDLIERLLNEAEALNSTELAPLDNYSAVIGYLHSGRNHLAMARADLAGAARNRTALGEASQRIADIAGGLAADLGRGAPTTTGSLGFGDPSEVADLRDGLNSPPPLPPSFPGGVPRLEEVENSPGYDAWVRGMEAAARRDWTLAAAWFGTARLRDPNNAALGRAVALAEWTRDAYLRAPMRAAAALRAPTDADLALLFPAPDPALQVPDEADLALLFPGPDLPAATFEERRRSEIAQRSNSTLPEDMDLLMRDSGQDRLEMVGGVPLAERRRLAEHGVTLPRANDWTDQLAPEVRGMISELRAALPSRTYGPPNLTAPPSEQLRGGLGELAQGFGDEAIVRILYGDLAGAERALGDASQFGDGFGPAFQLIQEWRGETPTNELGLAPGGSTQRR